MYIIFSIITFLVMSLFLALSIALLIDCIRRHKCERLTLFELARFFLCLIFSISLILTHFEYLYPFERYIPVKLYAEVSIDCEDTVHTIRWHGIYDETCISADSPFFDTERNSSWLEDDYSVMVSWPKMDLKKNYYIVSYGSKIHTIAYNVWDNIDHPGYVNVKEGHVTFEEEYDCSKIYIYQIPRIRIDCHG